MNEEMDAVLNQDFLWILYAVCLLLVVRWKSPSSCNGLFYFIETYMNEWQKRKWDYSCWLNNYYSHALPIESVCTEKWCRALFGCTPTKWLLSSLSASDGKEPNSAKQIGPQGISRIRAKHNGEFIFCSFSDNILGFLCWKILPALSCSSLYWQDVFLFWPSRWFNARLAIRWQMWPLRRCIKADHNPASWHWHCLSTECSGPVWFGTAGSSVHNSLHFVVSTICW